MRCPIICNFIKYCQGYQIKDIRWAVHVVRMTERRDAYNILVGNLERKRPSEDLGVDGRFILNRF